MNCPKCSQQNADDAQFCRSCGCLLTNLGSQPGDKLDSLLVHDPPAGARK